MGSRTLCFLALANEDEVLMVAFNSLNLFFELLRDVEAFVTTEPPSDIADRLPALIIESSAPVQVKNVEHPGSGALVSVTLNAVAGTDEQAWELIDSAYTRLWESKHKVTRWGWVVRCEDVEAPFLVRSEQTAQNLYQYTCALQCVIRK